MRTIVGATVLMAATDVNIAVSSPAAGWVWALDACATGLWVAAMALVLRSRRSGRHRR